MRTITLTIVTLLLGSCASLHSNDPDALRFNIPEGSILSLNKPLTIPQSDTHTVIQFSKEIEDRKKNEYEINCRVDFKKFGSREIQPEDFTITRTEDGTNWISQPSILRFYTEVHLSSSKGTDIIMMECQQYGDPIDRNFTVAEMQTALGDVFTFKYKTQPWDTPILLSLLIVLRVHSKYRFTHVLNNIYVDEFSYR